MGNISEPNKNERSELAEAFGFSGFRKSWSKWDNIVDAMPFEDPLEAEDWKKRLRDDKKLRYAMEDEATEKFLRMLKKRLAPYRNFIIMFCGPMGGGKSIGECKICWIVQQEIPTATYKVVMGLNAIRVVLPTLPPHGICVNDEDLGLTGKGSNTVAVHVSNQLKFAREGERNLILSEKWYVNIHIANYYLECFGFDPSTGASRFMLRSRTGRWLGVVTLKENFPPEFYQPFIDAKKKMDKQMAKNRGELPAFAEFDMAASVETIETMLREIKFPSTRKSLIKAFILQESELEENQDKPELQIPMLMLPDVIARVQVNLLRNPIPKQPKKESNAPKVVWVESADGSKELKRLPCTLLEKYKDETFLPRILSHLERRGMPLIKVNVLALKCQHESNLDIHKRLDISTGSVSNFFHDVTGKQLGYAGEDARDDVLNEQGIPHKKGGENKPDPDQIIYEPHHVESVKTYYIFRLSKAAEEIGDQEIAYAQKHGVPLILRGFECYSQTFHVYRVELETLNHHHQSSSCEVRNSPGVMNTPSPPPPAAPRCDPRKPAAHPAGEGGAQEWSAIERLLTLKTRFGDGETLTFDELEELYHGLYKAGHTAFIINGKDHPDTRAIMQLCAIVKREQERLQQQKSASSKIEGPPGAPGSLDPAPPKNANPPKKSPKKRVKGKKRRGKR